MNLFSTRQLEKDQFFEANLVLWPYCNLKCAYCFANPSLPPSGFNEEADNRLHKMATFLQETGRWALTISGGEPTIHPGFGEFCSQLASAGNQISIISNGTRPFSKVFPDDTVKSLTSVTLSLQTIHEESERDMNTLKRNIELLQGHDIDLIVNYVLYPGRKSDPARLFDEFMDMGIRLRFKPFMGTHEEKQYPRDYAEKDKALIQTNGDLDSMFITEHEFYMPTFKKCNAGHRTFYLAGQTGGVHICESLQQKEIVNMYDEGSSEAFLDRILKEPGDCPAKKCFCWPTVEQEAFLEKHDLLDLDHYAEWEKVSLPSSKAVAYWNDAESAFIDELDTHLQGENIFLWGGGIHTISLLKLLHKHGYPLQHFVGIIDTNPLQKGKNIYGLSVCSPDEFISKSLNTCSDIVISSRSYEKDIKAQISNLIAAPLNVVSLYDGSMKNEFDTLSI